MHTRHVRDWRLAVGTPVVPVRVSAQDRRATLQEGDGDRAMCFFSSRRRHTRYWRDWSSDVCSSDLSSNYMVQDLCLYLQLLGVGIEGLGTTTLVVRGRPVLDADVDYTISEDPVEAMSLLTAGIVTDSELTVERAPVEFLEIELAVLAEMGLRIDRSADYLAANGHTRLADLTIRPSTLKAPIDKIHPMPFPGLNIDNLPFFAVIAAHATGETLIHDWVYDNRAIHLSDLTRLAANVRLLDPHRVLVTGPTRWSSAEVVCPPALRPAVCILLAMLAAKGTSVLRNVDIIARGYEHLYERLVEMGARIEVFHD